MHPGEGSARKSREATPLPAEKPLSAPPQTASTGEPSAISADDPSTPPTSPSSTREDPHKTTSEALVDQVDQSTEASEAIPIPPDADDTFLTQLALPPLPYSIYMGAHKSIEEAKTTQREHVSNYLPCFIVPVEVRGEIGQSLFGVTQEGLWYAVLIGHFPSKDRARKTLGRMMQERTEGQPEIMQFPYALDCGRTLEENRALQMVENLSQAGFFPYTLDYPLEDGRTLTRILVGCHFSEQGALATGALLEQKGFLSCRTNLK